MDSSPEVVSTRRSARSKRGRQRLQSRDSDKNISDKTSNKSDDWKYNDASSSGSEEEEREKPPPSKRVGARTRVMRKKQIKKTRSKYSSEDETSEGYSEEESRRALSRRTAGTVSYKEASEDEKTDSEDLVEVESNEATEVVPEEKCETIEKVLSQRRGKPGGKSIMRFKEFFV